MGSHHYWYFVPYQEDLNKALQELREREFKAGRYNPVIRYLEFPIGPNSPSPGAQHSSIEEAFCDAECDGTRSILDIESIGEKSDFGVVTSLPKDKLIQLFGTDKPTHEMIMMLEGDSHEIKRGHGIYIIVYENNKPSEILFEGYSFD